MVVVVVVVVVVVGTWNAGLPRAEFRHALHA